FPADEHDLFAIPLDPDQLLAHCLAILGRFELVLAGLEPNFLSPCSGDDDLFPVNADANAGIIRLDDECAFARDQANHRAAYVGDVGRLANAQAEDAQYEDGGSEPEAVLPGERSRVRAPWTCTWRRRDPAREGGAESGQQVRHLAGRGEAIFRLLGV